MDPDVSVQGGSEVPLCSTCTALVCLVQLQTNHLHGDLTEIKDWFVHWQMYIRHAGNSGGTDAC